MVRATRFTDPAAVDAWDSWFRWRDGDCLHDRTIDATWWRVANAIVPRSPEGLRLAHRYVDAFSRWQLLPDERLLRGAGTGACMDALESPCAVLNVAAFVTAPRTRHARFDDERFAGIAALAVRLLDDALVASRRMRADAIALRVGLIGFADALHLLGIDHEDARAIELVELVGATLASGTLQGSLELARERGALAPAPEHLLWSWRDRRVPDGLIDTAAWTGVRHSCLTAIEMQPLLASLANGASDALEPRSLPRARDGAATTHPAMSGNAGAASRRELYAAIQPWIDAPIDASLSLSTPTQQGVPS